MHGRIDPSKYLMNIDSIEGLPKLSDFRYASYFEEDILIIADPILNELNLEFTAPEIFEGK